MRQDEGLRRLAREVSEDPSRLPALEAAWIRAGLGWSGQALPKGVVAKPERGVYFFVGPLSTELVYVSGGGLAPFYLGRYPVTCREWWSFRGGVESVERPHHPVVNASHANALAFCEWAGFRLPTADEWRWAALGAPLSRKGLGITCLVFGRGRRAKQLCSGIEAQGEGVRAVWAYSPDQIRGRNPDRTRWLSSGEGAPGESELAAECHGRGIQAWEGFPWRRLYPWGDEPPTPERCVWAGHPEHGFNVVRVTSTQARYSTRGGAGLAVGTLVQYNDDGSLSPALDEAASVGTVVVAEPGEFTVNFNDLREPHGGSIAPVVKPESVVESRLVPARPAGASWCGAQEMAGNVWEWTADSEQAGGSFSTGATELCRVVGGREGSSSHLHRGRSSDDVGFRVALSAPA